MREFWESSFKDKEAMWGFEPADAAIATVELFRKNGLNKILIPGYGYGRNAKIFSDNGFDITGIEISETAIDIAKKKYGDHVHENALHVHGNIQKIYEYFEYSFR